MARFDTSGLDGVLAEMKREEQLVGPAADAMLMAGAEEVKKAWQRAAREHGHHDTGAMIESIGYPNQPKKANDVHSIDIYPTGKDSGGKHKNKPVRNAEKAFILNYGTSEHPGSGWVDDADKYSEQTAIPAMVAVWENYKG